MEDSDILLLLKKQPSEGLFEVTKKYGGTVKGVALKILHNNPQDIEECIADTFISLWKNIDSIDLSKGKLKSYLACIARNTAINRYNKIKREKTFYIQDTELSSDENIEDSLARKCDYETLKEVLMEMKEPDKEIFIRRYFLFEKIKEIAANLHLKEKTVENKIFRGKNKLRKQLLKRGVRQYNAF